MTIEIIYLHKYSKIKKWESFMTAFELVGNLFHDTWLFFAVNFLKNYIFDKYWEKPRICNDFRRKILTVTKAYPQRNYIFSLHK